MRSVAVRCCGAARHSGRLDRRSRDNSTLPPKLPLPLAGAFKAQTPRWPNGPLGQAGRGHELSVALSSMFCSPGAELDGQEILWLDRL